jgi:hypothetical protein
MRHQCILKWSRFLMIVCSIFIVVSISACGVSHIGIKTGGDEPQVKTKTHGPPPHAHAHG